MFNIKRRVYVINSVDMDFMSRRHLLLDKMYAGVATSPAYARWENRDQVGCLGKYNNLAEFLHEQCNDDIRDFFDKLSHEDQMVIVTDPQDYITLYAYVMCELQKTFDVKDEHIEFISSKQQLKDFLDGCQPMIPAIINDEFVNRFRAVKDNYSRSFLYKTSEVNDLPFEFCMMLSTYGYVEQKMFSPKMQKISRIFFENEVRSILTGAEISISNDPQILRIYTGNQYLTTSQDVVKVIYEDPALFRIFIEDDVDLEDAVLYDVICRLCEIAIEQRVGRDVETVQQRLDEFRENKRLYEARNMAVLTMSNPLIAEYIRMLDGKFNTMLLAAF